MKKLFIKTYGCQMNEYDSTKMMDILHDAYGLSLTNDPADADIILMNTCSIREKAQEKVFSELGRYYLIKQKKPNLIIGVGGCVASQESEAIVKRAPYVDVIFGPQTLHRLPELINDAMKQRKPVIDTSFPAIEKFDHLPAPKAEGPIAFVSIMEGCSKYCSFCVVPYTRGEEISRPFDDVLAEVAQLAEQGVREINLLGQNVNDYRGLMHGGEVADLALLIHYIAAIESIARIRFTTSHPNAFGDNLIQAYADEPKLANHLHLPVQSGSDRILSAMKRNYTALEYKSKIKKLKAVRPNIALSSDFIIGFPGETDEDFEATMDLIDTVDFDHSFSFIYSKRPGTPASNYPDDVSNDTKKERLARLQRKIINNTQRFGRQLVGSTQKVLVTGLAKKGDNKVAGRTECNRVVNFIADSDIIGQVVDVNITDAYPNSLGGELVKTEIPQQA